MRKQELNLPKQTAIQVAERLAKGMGKPNAKNLAASTAKTLKSIDTGDINPELFSVKHIRKQERFWTEVASILSK